jgi:effector-binding domain-containing protein
MLQPDLTAMLKGLKIRTEQIMQSSLYPVQIIQLPERQILSISDTTTPQRANRELYKMFSLIAQCINNQLLSKNGFPAASFNALNDTGLISISVQIPVKACIQNCPGIQCTKLPAQEALILTYTGNRNSISTAYHSIYKALSDRGLYNKSPIWEEYTKPASTLPSSVQSTIKLCYLIKNE